ncbi:MAG TPA: prolyl oligopeptidase family serine peptidase [Longimicrobiaceae bacterium]|nr:prolyl oligopeptidase family serine peptidase [Longimicrobiaceae bacterium]
MVRSYSMLLLAALWIPAASLAQQSVQQNGPGAEGLPRARRSEHAEVYHGVRVPDPYRWMEEMGSAETVEWTRAQDAYMRGFVAGPERDRIRAGIARAASTYVYSAPVREGGRYFFTRFRATGPNRQVTLLTRSSEDPEPRIVIDAEAMVAADGSAPVRAVPAPDGRTLVYGVVRDGSEWETLRIRDIDSGRELPERLTGIHRVSVLSWARAGEPGFFYTRYPLPAAGAELTTQVQGGGGRIFFHRVGTEQSADRPVFQSPEHAEWFLTPRVTDDGRYLVITSNRGAGRTARIYYQDLTRAGSPVVPLIPEGDAEYTFLGNSGPVFWFLTTQGAPLGRVIAVDIRRPARRHWTDLIPEAEEAFDTWNPPIAVGGRLLVPYRREGRFVAKVFDTAGRLQYEVPFPRVGSIWSGYVGRMQDSAAFYTMSGLVDPGTVYRLDMRTGRSTVFLRSETSYNPDDYVTEQVFYTSRDGTRVPMFLVYRKGFVRDGRAPGWMYGYGALNWAAAPWFQPHLVQWLDQGGIWAEPGTRGGGEYGEAWHEAGSRHRKQNGIDDYIAAAEWLVANRYTSTDRLVAHTSSAGGPLVAAAVVQRPDLFGASILEYPALDVLRYDQFTGGRRWLGEYGTTTDPEDFKALIAYSPHHNLREGTCYPAVLATPGEKDQTAVPMHAYKFVAGLQHAQGCNRPVLLRVSWGAGHTSGATLDDSIDNWADQLAFTLRVLPR